MTLRYIVSESGGWMTPIYYIIWDKYIQKRLPTTYEREVHARRAAYNMNFEKSQERESNE